MASRPEARSSIPRERSPSFATPADGISGSHMIARACRYERFEPLAKSRGCDRDKIGIAPFGDQDVTRKRP